MYITIRLDLKKSREQHSYKKMQDFLHHIKQHLSSPSDAACNVFPLQIRNGDEIIGIYTDLKVAFGLLEAIMVITKKMDLDSYIGIGIGSIDYGVDADIQTINGPSIWHATEAMNHAKKKGQQVKGNTIVMQTSYKAIYNDTLNVLLGFAAEIIVKRTSEQQEAVNLIKRYPHKSHAELYRHLKGLKTTGNEENNRINFTRYLTRSERDRYDAIVTCMMGICLDQEACL